MAQEKSLCFAALSGLHNTAETFCTSRSKAKWFVPGLHGSFMEAATILMYQQRIGGGGGVKNDSCFQEAASSPRQPHHHAQSFKR